MLSIGKFAAYCGTTVKTIRYYDEIGLLKADYISQESGYRYYRTSSKLTFTHITVLKEAGFNLTEIQEQIHSLSDTCVLTMLEEKAALLEKQRQLCLNLKNDYLRKVAAQQMEKTHQYLASVDIGESKITIGDVDTKDSFCFCAPSDHLHECAELVANSLQEHFICNEFDDLKMLLDGKEVYLWHLFCSKEATADVVENISYPEAFAIAPYVYPFVRFGPDEDIEVVEILGALERAFGKGDVFCFDADFDFDVEGIQITFMGIR